MTHPSLNTPLQAQHLSYLYGVPKIDNPKWFVVADKEFIESWLEQMQDTVIYGLRTWDEGQLEKSRDCSGMYVQLEHDVSWACVVPKLEAKSICVIRHGLPIGTRLKEAYNLIPSPYRSLLPKDNSYGMMMNRLADQETPKNPISRVELSALMRTYGWFYVCDLCAYRDFGHETENIEQRDVLCGLVWRDSLFVRVHPTWSLRHTIGYTLIWRVRTKERVQNGWIYTTPEGLQVGFRGEKPLDRYSEWSVLCSDHKEYVYSFIHSGLLTLGECTS